MNRRLAPLVMAALAAAAAGGSALAADVPLGPYVGAGYGHASLEEDNNGVSFDFEDGRDSWKLYGGMRLISFLDLEATYLDLGAFENSQNGLTVTTDAKAYSLCAVGSLPLLKILRVFGKAGVTYWDTKASFSNLRRAYESGTDWTWGAGVQVLMLKHLWLRGEYERFNAAPQYNGHTTGTRLDLYTLGLAWRF